MWACRWRMSRELKECHHPLRSSPRKRGPRGQAKKELDSRLRGNERSVLARHAFATYLDESVTQGLRHGHGRQNPDRTGSRRVPPAGRASAHAYRRAEHRLDESRGLLPQLPVELDEGCGGRQGRAADERREPRGGLRHAVRGVEGEAPDGSLAGAEGGAGEEPQALSCFVTTCQWRDSCPLPLRERASLRFQQTRMGEGSSPYPSPMPSVEIPSCPLPQGERAQ